MSKRKEKTIKEWMLELPDEHRKLAFKYQDKDWDLLSPNLSSALCSAFYFDRTDEGEIFWIKLYEACLKNENKTILQSIQSEMAERQERGISKYGGTLDQNPAEIAERLQHLKEELMDAIMYIEWIKSKL